MGSKWDPNARNDAGNVLRYRFGVVSLLHLQATMMFHAFVLLLGVVPLTFAATPGQSAYLDVAERFYIEWDYSDTNITILCRVKTTGWFGIGFSPNGGMSGADIVTAGVRDGVPFLQVRD